jgi:hypothetical protein
MIVELLQNENYEIKYLNYIGDDLINNDRAHFIMITPKCGMKKIYSLYHIYDIYKSDNEIDDLSDLNKFDKYYTIDKLVLDVFTNNGIEYGKIRSYNNYEEVTSETEVEDIDEKTS